MNSPRPLRSRTNATPSTTEVRAASADDHHAPGVLSNANWVAETRANRTQPIPQNGVIASAITTAWSPRSLSRALNARHEEALRPSGASVLPATGCQPPEPTYQHLRCHRRLVRHGFISPAEHPMTRSIRDKESTESLAL